MQILDSAPEGQGKLLLPVHHEGDRRTQRLEPSPGPGQGVGVAAERNVARGTKRETEPSASSSLLSSLKQSIYISKADRAAGRGDVQSRKLRTQEQDREGWLRSWIVLAWH